ncbi:hypothetical protein COCMIDRAFT_10490 [Bipolaris oryzae ATCC 44560]|uniref:Uncharacterized protein n=1 Tax=Bipolaris oryzae ATCC 44560 TaxID=930090 RepID=W6YP51_COCMI|nr:uncharacterized protein COCMIDRAFT_10490 [Bipolaris oryzae ATCC 44560]EUC39450.1 hypothetical protein COCMIDRAFT_10490 [Bipolaris oryzae ATCC 44560]
MTAALVPSRSTRVKWKAEAPKYIGAGVYICSQPFLLYTNMLSSYETFDSARSSPYPYAMLNDLNERRPATAILASPARAITRQ